MIKTSKNYYFLDKKKLLKNSKSITARIETMTETFASFNEILEGLKKDPYLEFQYLFERAGLNDKILKKVSRALENYRDLYFKQLGDIQQTSLDEYKIKK